MNTIIITGASGILGTELCTFFEKKDFKIVGTYYSDDSEKKLKQKFGKDNGHKFFQVDFHDAKSVNTFLKITEGLKGNIFLINNARSLKSMNKSFENAFNQEISMNVTIPYKIASNMLIKGISLQSIINLGSIYGLRHPKKTLYPNLKDDDLLAYGVSKSSLITITKEMAIRFGKYNCRVNCISLGGLIGRADKKFQSAYQNECLYDGMVDPKSVMDIFDFLLSEKSRTITGQNIVADNGFTLK